MKKDIYIIKNDINNKVYIGQSNDPKKRFQTHCKPSAVYLNNEIIGKAIQKYGKNHFWYEIIESQIENYNEREIYWIRKYNSIVPNGYNLLSGGNEPPLLKGENSSTGILTQEQVEDLTNDLRNTQITMDDLANKYGFSSVTSISEFNSGKTYIRDIQYPIRKENVRKLNHVDVLEIIDMLKHTYLSFEEIANKYNVEYRTISRINRGIAHRVPNEKYPIRDGKIGSKSPNLTYSQVSNIINLLLATNLSLRAIAKIENCNYRDVLEIKNGTKKLYRRTNLTYPLRPNH